MRRIESANAGPTATTTSVGIVTLSPPRPRSDTIGSAPSRLAEQLRRSDDLRQRLEELPALALEPVAGSRARVLVRVVDRRADDAVGVDDRRRLQVVGRDPLALHPEHGLRDVGEAAAVERERDVEPRDTAREQLVGRLDVGGAVAIGHLARVVARSSRRATSSSEIGGSPSSANTACTARAARSRTRRSSSSETGSIPASTCQSRWIVSHSSRSSASKFPPPNVLSWRGMTE